MKVVIPNTALAKAHKERFVLRGTDQRFYSLSVSLHRSPNSSFFHPLPLILAIFSLNSSSSACYPTEVTTEKTIKSNLKFDYMSVSYLIMSRFLVFTIIETWRVKCAGGLPLQGQGKGKKTNDFVCLRERERTLDLSGVTARGSRAQASDSGQGSCACASRSSLRELNYKIDTQRGNFILLYRCRHRQRKGRLLFNIRRFCGMRISSCETKRAFIFLLY